MASKRLRSGYALLASLLFRSTRGQTAYESIFTLDAFSAQPTCVQKCFRAGYEFQGINCYTDVLGEMLGCANTACVQVYAAVDDCYCREDYQTAAHDLLGMCIDRGCSVGDNAVNLATAVAIYSGYCSARGFAALPASTTAATTTSKVTGAATASAGSNAQSGPTPTSTSSTTDPSSTVLSSSSTAPSSTVIPSSKTKTLTIALSCVGALAVVVIITAATFCYRSRPPRLPPSPPAIQSNPSETPSIQSWFDQLPELGPNDSATQVNGSGVAWTEQSYVMSDINGTQRSMGGRGYSPRY